MLKSILIEPVDDEVELYAKSLNILNSFKKLGFVKREAFVELIMGEDKSYENFDGIKLLNRYWALRVKDKNVNENLEKILENLKSS